MRLLEAMLGVFCALFCASGVVAEDKCTVPDVSDAEKRQIQSISCSKVSVADDQNPLLKSFSRSNRQALQARTDAALKQCDLSNAQRFTHPAQAAETALKAWMSVTGGAECCNRAKLPFCVAEEETLSHLFPAGFGLLFFIIFTATPLVSRKSFTAPNLLFTKRKQSLPAAVIAQLAGSEGEAVASVEEVLRRTEVDSARQATDQVVEPDMMLRTELRNRWLGQNVASGTPAGSKASLLRELPHAAEWAEAAADLFSLLCANFEFQEDNCRNQFEHLLSLWYSQVAMVGDAAIAQHPDRTVTEEDFLVKALKRLHSELMEGFFIWKKKLYADSEQDFKREPRLGGLMSGSAGTRWPPTGLNKEGVRQLTEVVVFLLVWGEAGNLRFMPEVLYYITECILASNAPASGNGGFYGPMEPRVGKRSGRFLSVIIRPVYNVIFNANHEKVGVDVPVLRVTVAGVPKVLKGHAPARMRANAALKPKLQVANVSEAAQQNPQRNDQEEWIFEPVDFDNERRLVIRIRWNADSSYCLHVADGEVQIQRVTDDLEDRFRQLFHHDEQQGELIWLGRADDPQQFTVVGSFVRLRPRDPTSEQKFNVKVVDKKSGKDQKALRKGYTTFMPPDMPNYDDWNEVFNNPQELLQQRLKLFSGGKIFDMEMPKQFAALRSVDWQGSLGTIKTHREIHSWWGAFASLHRALWLHLLSYTVVTLIVTSSRAAPAGGDTSPILGSSPKIGFTILAPLAALYAFCLKFAAWATTGRTLRDESVRSLRTWLRSVLTTVWWLSLILIWALILYLDKEGNDAVEGLLAVCYAMSAGSCIILLLPNYISKHDQQFELTRNPRLVKFGRWMFWIIVFGAKAAFGAMMVGVLHKANDSLLVGHFLHDSRPELRLLKDPGFCRDVLEWLFIWAVGLILFVTDTQLWFVGGCTIAGMLLGFSHRSWRLGKFIGEDAVAAIAQRFSEKVLKYDHAGTPQAPYSSWFPAVWDRIIDYMRYEDKVLDLATELSFDRRDRKPRWSYLSTFPAQPYRGQAVPALFTPKVCLERILRRDVHLLPDPTWPSNMEARWRLSALSRCLSLDLPRPFRPPYMPGLTVLVPHYGEPIITDVKSVVEGSGSNVVPLMSWLKGRYPEEFSAFVARMSQDTSRDMSWKNLGDDWRRYSPAQLEKLRMWASMRSQTLWRTIAGMMLYDPALRMHNNVQGFKKSALHKTWSTSDCFTLLVTMQMYKFFNKDQLQDAEKMLQKFPLNLKIAFIDCEDKGPYGKEDTVHPAQARRYFSCLVDKDCKYEDDAKQKRAPRFRIELPGFPILGDGKGDNQNHAIPFTRGPFIQCIDANQGAYFEQMCLLPCVLGEFRDEDVHPWGTKACYRWGGEPSGSKKIIGFPEHIFSDIGSIGDFAASAEFAFGTILQRSYASLGGRMHYGHPDMMSKVHIMQQGGVSKATRTVNLSEDIFAGMDFTLRGAGRRIVHREYFFVTKGRDMGFSTVLLFFMKLSSGSGEVVLTRQSLRLGRLLDLPEFLTFYYAHVGYYLTQFLVSKCPVLLTFLWLLLVANDAEPNWKAMDPRVGLTDSYPSNAETAVYLLSSTFSAVVVAFLLASQLPFLVEVWMQQGVLVMFGRFLKQWFTFSPLHFIFQAKVIGIYITNELQRGGAGYIATGRGLPTQRRPFVGEKGGLYMDFAAIAFYDGVRLLGAAVLAFIAGGATYDKAPLAWWLLMLGMTIVSWLYAPFIFNPYQFAFRHLKEDWKSIWQFFTKKGGKTWIGWYESTQLRRGAGFRITIFDVLYWCFLISIWYSAVDAKVAQYIMLLPSSLWKWLPKIPCGLVSFAFCMVAAALEPCLGKRWDGDFRNAPTFNIAVIAVIVMGVDAVEVAISVANLLVSGWWKAITATLCLKYCLLSLTLSCAESLLRLGWCSWSCCHWFDATLRLWLYGHRMAMDMLVCIIIAGPLAVPSFLDFLREKCLPGCSLHHLIVFRDPGTRTPLLQADLLDENIDSSPNLAHELGGLPALPPVPPVPPPTDIHMAPSQGSEAHPPSEQSAASYSTPQPAAQPALTPPHPQMPQRPPPQRLPQPQQPSAAAPAQAAPAHPKQGAVAAALQEVDEDDDFESMVREGGGARASIEALMMKKDTSQK